MIDSEREREMKLIELFDRPVNYKWFEQRDNVNESLEDWKSENWIHYSVLPQMTIHPKQYHFDPAGIYFFPEEFKPVGSWKEKPYKIIAKLNPAAKVLDFSRIDQSVLQKMNDTISDTNYDKTDLKAVWDKLKVVFRRAPGRFNKFFRDMGYDAIFDDLRIIHVAEIQLVVLNPKVIKIQKLIDTKRSYNRFETVKKVMLDIINIGNSLNLPVNAERPTKRKKGDYIRGNIVIGDNSDFKNHYATIAVKADMDSADIVVTCYMPGLFTLRYSMIDNQYLGSGLHRFKEALKDSFKNEEFYKDKLHERRYPNSEFDEKSVKDTIDRTYQHLPKEKLQLITKFNGVEIRKLQKNSNAIYLIYHGNIVVGFVVGSTTRKNSFVIVATGILSPYRGKGIIRTLYLILYELHQNLVSDKGQTKNGTSIWIGLMKTHPVYVIDNYNQTYSLLRKKEGSNRLSSKINVYGEYTRLALLSNEILQKWENKDKDKDKDKEPITELFKQSLPYQWEKNNPDGWYGSFMVNDKKYQVSFEKDNHKIWNVVFSMNDKTDITHTGDAYKVFSTILSMSSEFIKKQKPPTISFLAWEPSRKKLYASLASRLGEMFHYDETLIDNTFYMIKRRKGKSLN